MPAYSDNHFNPNPITKITVILILGFAAIHYNSDIFALSLVIICSILYIINGYFIDAVKNLILYFIIFSIPNYEGMYHFNLLIKMVLSFLILVKIAYLPLMFGKYFIRTTDVGSIISSMDKLKVPYYFSIPIAVMFRFFPSFLEERKNIKIAMKIRGIRTINPIKYLRYVSIPLLIISSNLIDDISKAAETKCIADPVKKQRYIKLKIKAIDIILLIVVIALMIWGK
ncbi:TPA: energy-coupling factor transporter transmembrane component T [Streptococcus agalactiae]|uniref:energy-coupling factor transporter transmembrane component T n=1 Tax=Peptoniphilaceae TaxID=1570339 RepID=UPI0022388D61|nr:MULTISPECIES: energy-coupling factor transporter transmembrane component T [Peptoniphilaceae]HAQ9721391.1 energy-coupling factor transporter transmembrane protein EcfT [Enterococcus faecium]MCW6702594.1 energy-coupling factor transporter transmembrane protein EcfT [Anaerococcus sp. NML200537]MDU5071223.1 energy-coupling factor transporter transmembrane component T [Finegoldia magna]MDU5253200.1 energy-coupling factor transporter transmembrane component T [Anaerococcus vaginalis]MDU6782005.1